MEAPVNSPHSQAVPAVFLALSDENFDASIHNPRKLGNEEQRIMNRLDTVVFNDQIDLIVRKNLKTQEVYEAFERYGDRVTIFHFGGFPRGLQELLKEESGRGLALNYGLVEFLARQDALQVIFLSGVSSAEEMRNLGQRTGKVVMGVTAEAGDEEGLSFVEGFYQMLAGGGSIKDAWEYSVNLIKAAPTFKGKKSRMEAPDYEIYVPEHMQHIWEWRLLNEMPIEEPPIQQQTAQQNIQSNIQIPVEPNIEGPEIQTTETVTPPPTREQLIERIAYSSFQADSVDGKDQLGITPDVEAFANLISSRELKPPLSIGLFGDWGSGKSFFMQKMREAVEGNVQWVRQKARQAAEEFEAELGDTDDPTGLILDLLPEETRLFDELMDEIKDRPGQAYGSLTRLFGTEAESIIQQLPTHRTEAENRIRTRLSEARQALASELAEGVKKGDEEVRKVLFRLKKTQEANRLGYCQHIAQIEFNAWHYIDTNLWASLTTNILEDLNTYLGNLPSGDREEIQLYQQLATTQELYEQNQAKKEAIVKEKERLQGELLTLQEERKKVREELAGINLKQVWGVLQEQPQVKEAVETIDGKVEEARDQLGFKPLVKEGEARWAEIKAVYDKYNSARGRLSVWLKEFEAASGKTKWLLLLFLVLPILALISLPFLKTLPGIPTGIISVSSQLVAAGFALLKLVPDLIKISYTVLKKINVGLDALAEAREQVNKLEDQASAAVDQQIEAKQAELNALVSQEEATNQQMREIEAQLAETEREISAIQRGKRLSAFIEGRLDSNDYQQHLGLVSLIRNDFEKLTAYLKDRDYLSQLLSKTEAEKEGNRNPFLQSINRVDRIVLYIDDMDRCPPEKVVDVLQAIHLILAFDLFVIVVGVDVRWISRSLLKQYGSMLGSPEGETLSEDEADDFLKGSATPFDYLEKIFQIPFRLKPMDEAAKHTYVTSLLSSDVTAHENVPTGAASPNLAPASPEGNAPHDPAPIAPTKPAAEKLSQAEVDSLLSNDAPSQKTVVTPTPQPNLPPEVIRQLERVALSTNELSFITLLTPILSDSPRAIKRFVNICRLIKSHEIWGQEEQTPMGPFTQYEQMVFLLAVIGGTPEVAQHFFEQLSETVEMPGNAMITLGELIGQMDVNIRAEQHADSFMEEWEAFYQTLYPLPGPDQNPRQLQLVQMELETLDRLAQMAIRFSFRFERY